MSEAYNRAVNNDVEVKACDILTDNQDIITAALIDNQSITTLARLDLDRVFDEAMNDKIHTLEESARIIKVYGSPSEISNMWCGGAQELIKRATCTFRLEVWEKFESIYLDMTEAFDERKEDMEPANAALSAFEVCIKPKKAHDPIIQCFHCSANLLKVGVIEVCEGGTAETPISFKNGVAVHGTTLISNMESTHIKCGACKKEVDVGTDHLLDIY